MATTNPRTASPDRGQRQSQPPRDVNLAIDTAPAVTTSPALPLRPFAAATSALPHPFHSFIIDIQCRQDASLTFSDPPTHSSLVPVVGLLYPEFLLLKTSRIRPNHLSWVKFQEQVQRAFGFSYHLSTCELGAKFLSPYEGFGEEYVSITSEVTFHNAISRWYNSAGWSAHPQALSVYLWNPIPPDPLFKQSRRAALAAQKRAEALHPTGETNATSNPSTPPGSRPDPDLTHEPSDTDHQAYDLESAPSPSIRYLSPHLADSPAPAAVAAPLLPATEGEDPTSSQQGFQFDPTVLLKHLPQHIVNKPNREEFDSEEEYDEEMARYLQYLLDLDLARIANGIDNEACMHLSDSIWQETCALFNHDPDQRQPDRCVKVPRFGRALLPVQAHAVWYALQQIHGLLLSVILAHVMGIGKTTMALCIAHVQHEINCMYAEIREFPDQHCPPGTVDRTMVCPSRETMFSKWGFHCPCAPTSPTYFVKERLGVSVCLSPTGLLDVWKAEHKACFPSLSVSPHHPQRRILYLAHHSNSQGLTPELRQLLVGRERRFHDPKSKHPLRSIYEPLLRNGEVFVLSTSDSLDKQFLQPVAGTRTHTYRPPAEKRIVKGGLPRTVQPRDRTITTKPFQTVIISILIKDEFHLRKTPTVAAIKKAQDLQGKGLASQDSRTWGDQTFHQIALVLMSGTPLTTGPSDIAPFIPLMSYPAWEHDSVLRLWMNNELDDLGKRWATYCTRAANATASTSQASDKLAAEQQRNEALRDEVLCRFTPLVERLFLRFTTTSDFLGFPPVRVPRNLFSEIKCRHPPAWSTKVNDLASHEVQQFQKKELARLYKYRQLHGGDTTRYIPLSKTSSNVYYRSRLCASFPALMDLQHNDGTPLSLTAKEWAEHQPVRKDPPPSHPDDEDDDDVDDAEEWEPGTMSDPYYSNLEALVQSSGKIAEIEKKIDEFSTIKDGEGKQARLVFASCFFTATYILYLWMIHVKKIPKKDIVFVHSKMTSKEITRRLSKFHVDPESPTPIGEQHTAKYIVGMSSVIATGLTLAEGIAVASLEPDFHAEMIAQLYSRHWRQGNKNIEVYSWSFVADGSVVEEKILDTSKLREAIQAAASRKATVAAGTRVKVSELPSPADQQVSRGQEVEEADELHGDFSNEDLYTLA